MERTTPHNLDGLVRLSRREGVDIRPALLRVLTDLYVQEKSHSRDAEQQYTELALHLLPLVDAPTRAAVAGKLAHYPLTPAILRDRLADDVAEVVAALHQPQQSAVASGDDLGWVEPRRPGYVATAGVPISAARPERLRPQSNETALPSGDAFLQASRSERLDILDLLERRLPTNAETPPSAPMTDSVARLETAARAADTQAFARELQSALRITSAAAARIATDPSGEPLLIAARALDASSAAVQRILLFLDPVIGRSVERVFALSHLYAGLGRAVAEHLLADWREAASRRNAARHVGLHAEEGVPSSAGPMDTARRAPAPRMPESTRRQEVARDTALRQRRS